MKKLMLGNEAVARGLYEAGCALVSSYPGTPSTEITEAAATYDEIYTEWAPNEKVAMEVAHGASMAGRRSCCCMKHVGLNVAADPLFTSSYIGVNGGMLICVADDAGIHSSQNEQDSRHYAQAAKLPMLEPADSDEARRFAALAFELSERFNTPVFLKTCTRIAHSQSIVELSERNVPAPKPYVKDAGRVMLPAGARAAHLRVEERGRALVEYAETTPINRVERGGRELGIITSSTCYQYAKEVFGDKASILKLGMINPLPEQLIRDFAAGVDRVLVLEELDPVIERHCRELGLQVDGKNILPLEGEYSPNLIAAACGLTVESGPALEEAIPGRPPVMCAGCPHRGVFYTLSKLKCTVYGDIGCYTLGANAPLSAMDVCICMGGSISGLHGFNKAGGAENERRSVAVIGDSTFMHSGLTGLVNMSYNQSNGVVMILDNSTTGMTGHQENPLTGVTLKGDPTAHINLEALVRSIGIDRVRVVDPYDLPALEAALKEELAAAAPSVIICRRPCALLKTVKPQPPLSVDKDKCKNCRLCMKLACPAISIGADGKPEIDVTSCVGCGVCRQLCKFDALDRR